MKSTANWRCCLIFEALIMMWYAHNPTWMHQPTRDSVLG